MMVDKAKRGQGQEPMREYVMEVRKCMATNQWWGRSNMTMGQWLATPWSADRQYALVKMDLMMMNPGWVIVWPEEEQGVKWEDA